MDSETNDNAPEQQAAVVEVVASEPAFHRVQPGEDWQQIADAYGVAVADLHALNADMPYFSERAVPANQFVRVA